MLYNTRKCYGLVDFVYSAICKGQYITMPEWKRLVLQHVRDRDNRKKFILSKMYGNLSIIQGCKNNTVSQWWMHCFYNPRQTRKCICVVKLLLQIGRLRVRKCCLCYSAYSVTHLLFQCASMSQYREQLWLTLDIPVTFKLSLDSLSDFDRTF